MLRRVSVIPMTGAMLALLLLTSLAQPAWAQRRGARDRGEPDREEIAGRGFFQAGYIGLDMDDLNASLVGAGYPSLDGTFLTLGGGGYGHHGRFLIGGEGHGLLGSEETTVGGARQLDPSGGYGLFRLGYMAFSRSGLDVFPVFGIGGGGMSLKISERSAPTFDDVLADPERSSTLSTGMFLLDLSLAVHYRVRVERSDEGDGGGLLLGLQTGYTFAPGDPSWDLDEINSVAGGPDLQIEGFYIRLSLGGWGEDDDGR